MVERSEINSRLLYVGRRCTTRPITRSNRIRRCWSFSSCSRRCIRRRPGSTTNRIRRVWPTVRIGLGGARRTPRRRRATSRCSFSRVVCRGGTCRWSVSIVATSTMPNRYRRPWMSRCWRASCWRKRRRGR